MNKLLLLSFFFSSIAYAHNFIDQFFGELEKDKKYSGTNAILLEDIPEGTILELDQDIVVNAKGFAYRSGATDEGSRSYYYSCRIMLKPELSKNVKLISAHDKNDNLPVVKEVEGYNTTNSQSLQLTRNIHFETSGMIDYLHCYFADSNVEPQIGHVIDIFPELQFDLASGVEKENKL